MNGTEPWANRSGPATYRICMYGEMSAVRLSRRIAMKVVVERDRRGRRVTRLTGVLANQAQLIAVLMALYEMGYTLVSLERADEPG